MNRLHELRKLKKVNQLDVASYLGISYQAYAHYEANRRQPDPDTLLKLADFFNVTVDYLLDRKNSLQGNNIDTLRFSDKTVVAIGHGGTREVYELNDNDAAFINDFIEKYVKNKKE